MLGTGEVQVSVGFIEGGEEGTLAGWVALGPPLPNALTLLGHLLLFLLRQGHVGERVGLGGDNLVKVDLVHAALIV